MDKNTLAKITTQYGNLYDIFIISTYVFNWVPPFHYLVEHLGQHACMQCRVTIKMMTNSKPIAT